MVLVKRDFSWVVTWKTCFFEALSRKRNKEFQQVVVKRDEDG
jgi:hypothetical protein